MPKTITGGNLRAAELLYVVKRVSGIDIINS